MSIAQVPRDHHELESEIGRAIIHFEKEFMGRGPLETKAYVLGDMILVRLKGVLTPSERKLCESQSDRSAYLLKQVRNELLVSGRPLLEAVIRDIVGAPVLSIHTDICTKTGERVFVFSLDRRPQRNGEKVIAEETSHIEAANSACREYLKPISGRSRMNGRRHLT